MRSWWLNSLRPLLAGATLSGTVCAQPPQPGDPAPTFILNKGLNTIESIVWPYQNKIVLLEFWSSETAGISEFHRRMNRLHRRYRSASYRNAEGFTVISIAAQNNEVAWKDAIDRDSLHEIVNGIAPRILEDQVCKKFGIDTLPYIVLVDENGKIVARNPGFAALEIALDDRRNSLPIRKTIVGRLALSTNRNEAMRFGHVYLFNSYGDSLGMRLTAENGLFRFEDIKLSQDLYLKVDNKTDINTTDPIALYTAAGDYMMDGRTRDGGFVFQLPPRMNGRLVETDTAATATSVFGEINVIKSLAFSEDGSALTPHDESEMKSILIRLQRNSVYQLEVITHTDARLDTSDARKLSIRQAAALKRFFESKGVKASRIITHAKGNSEPRKICDESAPCREEDHRLNRRVEFIVFKD